MRFLTIPTVILLYIIFSITSMLAGIYGILTLVTGTSRISRITRAMDCLLAAMLGFDGRSTVSKECGKSNCVLCKLLCKALHYTLEKEHCEKEAAR